MSWRKSKQDIVKKVKIKFDDEAFLVPSQVIKEFCDEYEIKKEELEKLFQWFTDPIGDHIYFVTKNCDLNITNLKTKPHKIILSSIVDYVNNFNQTLYNQMEEDAINLVKNTYYLKVNMKRFLNKTIYFVSHSSLSQSTYVQNEPFDRKLKEKGFMQIFYESALTKRDHS